MGVRTKLFENLIMRMREEQCANGASDDVLCIDSLLSCSPNTSVALLLSGGLDSTVLLFLTKFLGLSTYAIEFERNDRSYAECLCVKAAVARTGCELIIVDYPSARLRIEDSERAIPLAESNAIYFSAAGAVTVLKGIQYLICGTIYPDWESRQHTNATPEIFATIEKLLALEYGERAPAILTPFAYSSKVAVAALGRFLEVPLEISRSCETSEPVPCGRCSQCTEREMAIAGSIQFLEQDITR